MDLNSDILDKDVLIIEDILDTGLTAQKLINLLTSRQPKSLQFACLLKKPIQKLDLKIKYVGFELASDLFVVGYGTDFAGMRYSRINKFNIIKKRDIASYLLLQS